MSYVDQLVFDYALGGPGVGSNAAHSLVVTNLKWFFLKLTPLKKATRWIAGRRIPLHARLVYASGEVVCGHNNLNPLIGQTRVELINNVAEFKLKINPAAKITSDLHKKQHFRICVEAAEPGFDDFRLMTESFKVMVKITRAPPKTQSKRKRDDAQDGDAQDGDEPEADEPDSKKALREKIATEQEPSDRALGAEVDALGRDIKALQESNKRILAQLAAINERLGL
tara:strand:+ start:2098 stop:2775 length:678 start_codon:yes stop_codon:yes gene_type:complete